MVNVSAAVFKFSDDEAYHKLFNHWAYTDRDILSRDLLNIQTNVKNGCFDQIGMGTLWFHAKQNPNFPNDYGKVRKQNNKPVSLNLNVPQLLSLEEALLELKKVYYDFFSLNNLKSAVVAINTGVGKTQALIEVLLSIPFLKRILVLFPTHKLANQFYDDLVAAKQKRNKTESLKGQSRISFSKPLRGKTGKNGICDNKEIRGRFEREGLFIPAWVCHKCSHFYFETCKHIDQFNQWNNIRIMTHSEK